jgi:hypothetical protein
MRDGGISNEELLGLFESVHDNDMQCSDLKSQIKAITTDSGERFKAFSDDSEIEVKDLKQAYKYWVENLGKDPSEMNDDFFILVSQIDTILEEDIEAEAVSTKS